MDLERADCWVETLVTARKQHKCNCCRGYINKGDVYLRHFSALDNTAMSEKMCGFCTTIREQLSLCEEGWLRVPSDVREGLYENDLNEQLESIKSRTTAGLSERVESHKPVSAGSTPAPANLTLIKE